MNKWFVILLIVSALVIYILFAPSRNNTTLDDVLAIIPEVIHESKVIEKQVAIEQPEIKELNDLVSQYIVTKDPILLIKIGDIWRKGSHSRLSSDNKTAIKYYELAAGAGNKEVATLAAAKYIEAKEENIQDVDNVGRRLSDIYYEAIQAANAATVRQETIRDVSIIIPFIQATPDAIIPEIETPLFLNDKQNVHDHYMNKITKHNIDKLKIKFRSSGNIDELIDATTNNTELQLKSKATIVNVILSFSTSNHKYFDCSEASALELVYSHIKQHPDSKTLLHNLFLQLLDCYNSGVIVCSTGKISRVVSVVGDTENFEDQRNIYYIKQELESLAFRVREDELKKMSHEDVSAYNNGSETLAEQLKAKYIETVMAEYCDKLGIQYNIISPMVESNLIGF